MGNETRTLWLTRRQVARVLSMSEKQVAALDGIDFHPVRRVDKSWIYDPTELIGFVGGKATGVLTSRVFSMFKAGKSLEDVAIESAQSASRIKGLRAEYDDFIASLTVDPAALVKLKAILGAAAIRDVAHLIDVVGVELEARYRLGFNEGRADVTDLGEVINPKTHERKKVGPR